ncbi:MAG: acetate/propionate family kinase [Candidatus Aminicenantes bacterium]|nr:MAG: acetate/propionate family kinase [Candidatus Aminicenantes bacterium]
MDHIEKFLKELPLFKSFLPSELKKLIEKSHVKNFAPQEAIINFGQPGRFLGIILEGEAEAVVTSKTGEQIRLGLLEKGDFLGEMSLLTGEPTSADVIAIEKCELLLVPQDAFTTVVAVNPDAVKIIAKTVTDRLKNRQQNEEEQIRVEDAWQSVKDPYGLELSPASPMKILVINCGSSSLKFNYFDTAEEMNNLEGMVERIGLEGSCLISSTKEGKVTKELGSIGYEEAFGAVVNLLVDPKSGAIRDLEELSAVGHRVVHGGEKYGSAVIIDERVIKDIDKLSSLAPLHNPPNLMAIKESIKLMPEVPQVAVFDTGFHQKMPPHAFIYGLPYDSYKKDRIRRYGFHGISHNYVALQAATYLKRNFRELKIITCHLGNGASLCAIDHGRSVDTSMGLTPLEGLIMGTRCGDLDPSVVMHLCREKELSIQEVDDFLNRESGLKGLSGISSDLRMIEDAASKGDEKALLAIDSFCYRIRKYIGAYTAALGGLDALVFTAGIGEGSAWVRSLACQELSYMGIRVDMLANKTTSPGPGEVGDISDPLSQVKVLVIPTNEGRMIARETVRTLGYQDVSNVIKSQEEKKIPIEVSAHHVHLSRKEIDGLFGPTSQLSHRSDLSQPGQFACEETVNLIGPKGRVERVRVLGPERKESQVEISMTEEFKLGIKAPIRASGDLKGSPGITLEGLKGPSHILNGVICAARHIHMSPEDALSFGLKDRDIVRIEVKGERTLVFGDVLVRVHPDFRLSMHIDTDEANAASLITGMEGTLIGIQDRR